MLRLTLLLGDPWIGQTRLTLGFLLRAAVTMIVIFVFLRLFDRFMRGLQPPRAPGGDPERGGQKGPPPGKVTGRPEQPRRRIGTRGRGHAPIALPTIGQRSLPVRRRNHALLLPRGRAAGKS